MTTAVFNRSGFVLRYEDVGSGPPVLFQHGLGGSGAQVAEVFPDRPRVRRVTLECRAHGGSEAGPLNELTIAAFAGDVASLADQLDIRRAVVGGISMGAAIAVRLAVTRADLVGALVLGRPAWMFDPAPDNMQPVALIAELLRTEGASARDAFERSGTAVRLAREASDNLVSLRGFLDRSDRVTAAALLGAIATDGPGITEDEARMITVPTLIVGNRIDDIHPFEFATRLAATIPGAELIEISSKSVDRDRHVAEFRTALTTFLERVVG